MVLRVTKSILNVRDITSLGLGDSDVDVERLQAAMSFYQSKSEEWQSYAFYDRFRYTRNLVDDGNGKYNLLLLCWGPGMYTMMGAFSPVRRTPSVKLVLLIFNRPRLTDSRSRQRALPSQSHGWRAHGDALRLA